MTTTDVAIIGAGPIGLELAVALKRNAVDYLHFDAGQIGQTVSWFPNQAQFFSSPERIALAGVPLQTADQSKATREEYLAYLRSIVTMFDLQVSTYEKVDRIDKHAGAFTLTTHRSGLHHTYQARRIVLAVGDMARPRLLHIPGEDLPHVSHYFKDPHRYFRKRLLIVGGRNSAAEAALRCHRAGAHVSISYRRDMFDAQSIKYWILPELLSLIKAGRIHFLPNTTPTAITPTAVTLAEVQSHKTIPLENDFVLLLTGYVADTTLFELAGVELTGENRAPVHDPQTMATNVPGIYVAGTASAGTQNRFRLFIENCHDHADKIVKHITGRPSGLPPSPQYASPES